MAETSAGWGVGETVGLVLGVLAAVLAYPAVKVLKWVREGADPRHGGIFFLSGSFLRRLPDDMAQDVEAARLNRVFRGGPAVPPPSHDSNTAQHHDEII